MISTDQIAADVVRRARAGDQNAMALIAETRNSALQPEGNKARETLQAILKYCHKNPVPDTEPEFPLVPPTEFGEEVANTLGQLKDVTHQSCYANSVERDRSYLQAIAACLCDLSFEKNGKAGRVGSIILANGPPLINPRLHFIQQAFPDDRAKIVFQNAVAGTLEYTAPEILNAYPEVVFIGKVIGRARTIQLVRRSPQAIPLWSKQCHAEIGMDEDPYEVSDPYEEQPDRGEEEEYEEPSGDDSYEEPQEAPQQASGGGGGGGGGDSGGGGGGGGAAPSGGPSSPPRPQAPPASPPAPLRAPTMAPYKPIAMATPAASAPRAIAMRIAPPQAPRPAPRPAPRAPVARAAVRRR